MYEGQQKPLPPISIIREEVHYDPKTGVLTSYRYGYPTKGVAIRILGTQYFKHRVAYAHFYGVDPGQLLIDHIDGDPLNNRVENLRLATRSQNGRNRTAQDNNTSGFKGVSKWKNKWQARIGLHGYSKYLGLFDTPEEAYSAYCKAAQELHKEFHKL